MKPFGRGSKNDAVDAEAIFDAASRPTMRFVPVKTTDQQDLQSLHRIRDRLVAQRTSLINHTRGLLGEYGLVYPQGAARFGARARTGLAEATLSAMARVRSKRFSTNSTLWRCASASSTTALSPSVARMRRVAG